MFPLFKVPFAVKDVADNTRPPVGESAPHTGRDRNWCCLQHTNLPAQLHYTQLQTPYVILKQGSHTDNK
jgi:hypothetical protein